MLRDLGDVSKKAIIKRDHGVVRVNWVALQEIKLCKVDSYVVNQVCGCRD